MAIIGTHALPYTSEPEARITVMPGLPGGVEVMLDEPRHPIAIPAAER